MVKSIVAVEQDDQTPLNWAARNGLDQMVELHLNETDVDSQDEVGLWVTNERVCTAAPNLSEMSSCVLMRR